MSMQDGSTTTSPVVDKGVRVAEILPGVGVPIPQGEVVRRGQGEIERVALEDRGRTHTLGVEGDTCREVGDQNLEAPQGALGQREQVGRHRGDRGWRMMAGLIGGEEMRHSVNCVLPDRGIDKCEVHMYIRTGFSTGYLL